MQLQLIISNERRALPSVRAFVNGTLTAIPLSDDAARQLEELVLKAVTEAVEHAYPEGEEGSIELTIRELRGKLELSVRDFGLPQDTKQLDRQVCCPGASIVDEQHWLSYGPQGKALQLVKWLHDNHIADGECERSLSAFTDEVPLAPPQEYTVRRMLPDEAVQVSQLMYRAYGSTYFNEDVYYPDRVAAQHAHGCIISFVVIAANGQVVGHYALERNQEGPVAEAGQAVVDPAHRGRGLLDRLKEAFLEEARRLELIGWYADAVAVHTLTQQSHAHHDGHLCGVDLGIAPKTEAFRNIARQQSQRVSCMLYFHWLQPPAPRTIYVPRRYREMVATIYDNLRCPASIVEGKAPAGNGTLTVKFAANAGTAFIRVQQSGEDTLRAIRHAKRELVERSHAEAVFVDLPLFDPATPQLAEELEIDGLAFSGVAPQFSKRGDLLRLVYLVEPLQREPIKTFEPFANRLVEYALAEQARVSAAL